MNPTATVPSSTARTFLALRFFVAAAVVAAAFHLAPLPAAGSTLNPVCTQRCSNNSNSCVQGCHGAAACVRECRNIFDQCLSTCVVP